MFRRWRSRIARMRLFDPHLMAGVVHYQRADAPASCIGEIHLILHVSADDRCTATITVQTVSEACISLLARSSRQSTPRETCADLSVQHVLLHDGLPMTGSHRVRRFRSA